ncbi:hypothetical protein PsorP6_007769 [Peronosclerospora sorghi]|uniref:Uncharacterized protein n=1 Tax=Peronosclerospora sorghi TaxID=230839 RepID=A0ACC0W894_9STRA|nr:hypothetical protein PsorP6_007769 [Peronosclerospora sorghi]
MSSATAPVRSTTASGSAIYESTRAVHEYLQFHYGEPSVVVPYSFAPKDALQFLSRTVERCATLSALSHRDRALDIGCAVGRATFELSKYYHEAVGIDFSQHFVDAATQMKEKGEMEYEAHIQGDIVEIRRAKVPEGTFDVVFACNLLCRLPDPKTFLTKISERINPGGLFVLVSPYSWLEEYTRKDKWIGGVRDAEGNPVGSFCQIENLLSKDFELIERQDFPFLIREHERKYQWGVSDGTYWKRK